jgi:hypothetical protein
VVERVAVGVAVRWRRRANLIVVGLAEIEQRLLARRRRRRTCRRLVRLGIGRGGGSPAGIAAGAVACGGWVSVVQRLAGAGRVGLHDRIFDIERHGA